MTPKALALVEFCVDPSRRPAEMTHARAAWRRVFLVPARFENDLPGDYWSLIVEPVVDWLGALPDRFTASVYFRAFNAPREKLAPRAKVRLFHGTTLVATAVVLERDA